MQIYLVGGAVRDQLLGLPVKEKDWVVVGSTPEEMLRLGFRKVGRDFPVFLHPKTHEEYALARTERKTGKGYTNFICYAAPDVTLEDDLKRRDLTINAIAQTSAGQIVDPYNGRKDLTKHILRHVSPAFAEDPVRILRVARFAARFGNFKVHPETNALMYEMMVKGEVDALVPERVWQEFERALTENFPQRFFAVLAECQVLPKLFPAIAHDLPTIVQALQRAVQLSNDPVVRFAAIAYNLDSAAVKQLNHSYRVPRACGELALLVAKLHGELEKIDIREAEDLLHLLEQTDAYRRPERLQQFLLACLANNSKNKKICEQLEHVYNLTSKVRLTPKEVAAADKTKLRNLLHIKRLEKIKMSSR